MKNITLLLITLLVFISCQKTDNEILNKTISKLDEIETVKYISKIEITEKGKVLMSDTDNLYFDFSDNQSNNLKYHFKNETGELIYNGKESIQSDNEERNILTNKKPHALNPLINTLYPLKQILPKLINNSKVTTTRVSDSLIFGKKHYVFCFTIQKGNIDWMELDINNDIDYDSDFFLIIDKSDFLPKKIIYQNGINGAFSRTVENLDFNFKPEKGLWEGSNLPLDYARFDENEYYANLKNKLSSFIGGKIEDWELPSLKDSTQVNPSKLKGNVVLLEFWFENCGWCVKAIPALNKINNKFLAKSFKMYGIEFIKENDRENLVKYVQEKKIEYPTLYNGKSIASKYGIRSAPTFILVDKKGTIIYAQSTFNENEITELIEKSI